MNRRTQCSFRVLLAQWRGSLLAAVLTLGMLMFESPGQAQPVAGGQGLKFTEYYPPEHTQLKSMLECSQAQRQPDGRYLITNAKYRSFRLTGEGELNVEAPLCTYDQGQRTINSAGPIHAQTADGKFSIEGEGFLYLQTNSTLQISNRVHTIIIADLLGPQSATNRTNGPAAAARGMDIFSDHFDYAEDTGQGIYQGNVRVAGTNLNATAGRLTILLSTVDRQLKTLTAETNVIVDYVTPDHATAHATGERGFYSADTGLIQMSGQPTWRTGPREGSGDELVFDRTNKVLQASGHARLKVPSQSMGSSGLFSRPDTATAPAPMLTNQFVEILCDNYELRTNLAVFRQDVRVSDRLGEQLKGEMTCSLMTLTLAGTNELQKMVAEHQVVIKQEDKQFTAERAEYTGTNGLLDLTGNPAWKAGLREGKGDLMRVNLAHEEMLVSGNAVMKLPSAELGQSAFTGLGKPGGGESKAATNEFAEVYSQEYFLTPDSALFRGGVRIEHPQMKWACPEITMLSPPELGKDGRIMIAEPGVVFDVTDDQGRNFHGTGDKAVYTHRITATLTNDIMDLTGNPAVVEATNIVARNKLIILDLANHRFAAPGKSKLWAATPPGAPTTFGAPKTRLTK